MGEALITLIKYLPAIAAISLPVAIVWVVRHFQLKEKELAHSGRTDARQLEDFAKERQRLEARIQNLESIVCSVDFELSQRLNRLAAETSRSAPRLPAAPAAAQFDPSSPTAPAALADTVASVPPPKASGTSAAPVSLDYALGRLEVGRVVLGRYRIERELGRGGMGAVYLAHDSKLGEDVALKVISSAMAGDPAQAVARFHREVQAARRVTHPNVVRIHDLGEDGALLFLSMEHVAGETLAAWMRRRSAPPLAEALDILGDVALGVAAAHAAGVVHRDLKPHNVLIGVGATRLVKVIDFGLATTSFLAGMTATGMILGTVEYMAPEQVRGAACDARTDVYALGAMAHHVLSGQPPFSGETPIAIGFKHLSEAPRPVRELRRDVSEPVERAILRALSKEPAQRFADAAEWRRALVGG